MNINQAKAVDKYIDHKKNDDQQSGDGDDSNTESLTDLLDTIDDEFLALHRQKRLQELQQEFNQIDYSLNQGVGLKDLSKEHELMNYVTANDLVIIHFYQNNFPKCILVNNLINQLSQRHLGPLWLSINVKNCPFLVQKLQIKVLPCIAIYNRAILVKKILGYEFVENIPSNYIPTVQDLETYLLKIGILTRNAGKLGQIKSQLDSNQDTEDELDI
jgi:hypothetical protein